MAINFPGPYGLEMFYTTVFSGVSIQHKALWSVRLQTTPNVGDPFSAINVELHDGTFVALNTAIENWLAVLVTRWKTDASIDFIDLYQYVPLSFDRTFVSSYTPTANAGTSVGTTVAAQQMTYTFRTAEGGLVKVVMLETTESEQGQLGYGGLNAGQQNIVDFFLAGTSGFIIGRDTSEPVSFVRLSGGGNESLFRKRFR